MKSSVTYYLNATSQRLPDKTAFVDSNRELTFSQLKNEAYKIASLLALGGLRKKPVAIFLDKQVECICAMFGVAYSGNFYTVLDIHMPGERIKKITDCLQPEAIITDKAHEQAAAALFEGAAIVVYENAMLTTADEAMVRAAEERILSTDVLYVLFTSGSTGVPKGVIISHQAVIAYNDWLTETFHTDENTVFGNQTPFYFVMSGLDIFQTVANGCTTYIIPKLAFSFPVMLLEYLQENKINTLYWVPTALCMLADLNALKELHLDELKLVMFGGEVMPTKQLNMWMDEYPDVTFVNQYGPTEMTDICAYYVVDRRIPNNEALPIGRASAHMELMLLDEDNNPVAPGEIGELCGRGPSLASGYYRDAEKTEKAFVQNPLNSAYAEKIYRTGDLVKVNEYGELVYVSRKDFQIKHQGHRIELGEIETAVSAVEGVERVCCLYDSKRSRIIAFYTGSTDRKTISKCLKDKIPEYMIPNKIIQLEAMPLNLNGKIDRARLKERL